MAEKRDRVISVRVTDSDHQHLEARAVKAGQNLSDYTRRLLLHRPAVPTVRAVTSTAPHGSVIWDDGHCGNALTVRFA